MPLDNSKMAAIEAALVAGNKLETELLVDKYFACIPNDERCELLIELFAGALLQDNRAEAERLYKRFFHTIEDQDIRKQTQLCLDEQLNIHEELRGTGWTDKKPEPVLQGKQKNSDGESLDKGLAKCGLKSMSVKREPNKNKPIPDFIPAPDVKEDVSFDDQLIKIIVHLRAMIREGQTLTYWAKKCQVVLSEIPEIHHERFEDITEKAIVEEMTQLYRLAVYWGDGIVANRLHSILMEILDDPDKQTAIQLILDSFGNSQLSWPKDKKVRRVRVDYVKHGRVQLEWRIIIDKNVRPAAREKTLLELADIIEHIKEGVPPELEQWVVEKCNGIINYEREELVRQFPRECWSGNSDEAERIYNLVLSDYDNDPAEQASRQAILNQVVYSLKCNYPWLRK